MNATSGGSGSLNDPTDLPEWGNRLRALIGATTSEQLTRFVPTGAERPAAVLMLFGPGNGGDGDVVLLQRSAHLRKHPGQVAFPGGAIDPGETVVEAALREAAEETGLRADGVQVWGELPPVPLPVTNFAVHPVLAWWRQPQALTSHDPAETCRVVRVPLPELLEPANRFSTTLSTGGTGPGFVAGELFVWGFTAGLLAQVLDLAGLSRPWPVEEVREIPAHLRRRH